MKPSEALRLVAQGIERGTLTDGICVELLNLQRDGRLSGIGCGWALHWLGWCAPEHDYLSGYWFGSPANLGNADQSHRIIAACMAAAVAESEGD